MGAQSNASNIANITAFENPAYRGQGSPSNKMFKGVGNSVLFGVKVQGQAELNSFSKDFLGDLAAAKPDKDLAAEIEGALAEPTYVAR